MKFLIVAFGLMSSSLAFADKCTLQADAAAKSIMSLNQEGQRYTSVSNIRQVTDNVNTDYVTYDVNGYKSNGRRATLTYRISIDYHNSCRILGVQILGGN